MFTTTRILKAMGIKRLAAPTAQMERAADHAFDHFAAEYAFWIEHQPQQLPLSTIANLAQPDGKVLDVGCGDGRLSVELARRAYHVTGIDWAPAMIARANARAQQHELQNLTFHVADLQQLDFAAAQFDLIVSSFVLHLFCDQQLSWSIG